MKFLYPTSWLLVVFGFLLTGCTDEPVNTAPKPQLSVFPYAGDTTTIFTFDASKSSDHEDIRDKLSARWDWNGDGIWDTERDRQLKAVHRFSTKGMNYIRMELTDSDSVSVEAADSVRVFPIPVTGSMTDPRDGLTYRTVLLEGHWWMAESLKYGVFLHSDSAQTDNGIIEGYIYDDNPTNLDEYGMLYSWYEAVQYSETEKAQGVCPDGWHVPSYAEWKVIAPRDVPYLYLVYYYGVGGPGGLNLTYGGYYNFLWETNEQITQFGFGSLSSISGYWTSTHREEKVEDFKKNVAYQRRNLCMELLNPMSDSLFGGHFDNLGLYVLGDRIHLRGNRVVYDQFSPYLVNDRNAYFVRCIEDK